MGIIQQQALRNTIASYLGTGFGVVSRLLMTIFLSPLQIGVLALLDSISGSFVVLFNLGYNQILIKLFPKYRDPSKGHNGFLVLGLIISIIGILLGVGLYYLLEDYITTSKGDEGQALMVYAYLIPILILFRILYRNFDGYVRMLYNSVIGTLLDSFFAKLIFFSGMIMLSVTVINFDTLVYIYVLSMSLPGLLILLYSLKITKPIVWPKEIISTKKNKRKISQYIGYGVLMGASGSIVLYLDTLMLHKLLPKNSIDLVGIYSMMFFAALLITVPANGIKRISFTVLAESWKNNDTENIQSIYSKSAITQLIIGFYIFLIGWICLDPVLELLPKYTEGKYVFLFLGLAQVIEMGTGVNTEIISTSDKYYFNTVFNVILAIVVFVSNYFLIGAFGIIGAGIASFSAMTIINAFRWYFIKKEFGFTPITKNLIVAVLIGLTFLGLSSFVNYNANPFVTIIINIILLTSLYWLIILKLKLSEDINGWINKIRVKYTK